MAILDTHVTGSFTEDRNPDSFIGIELPFYKSDGAEGYIASTTTTVEAVKQNIRNLVQTEAGERIFQPNLGLNLRDYLFEPITSETESKIEDNIIITFERWLPFVNVEELNVKAYNGGQDEFSRNSISIYVKFNVNQVPNSLTSIELEV